MIDCSRLMQILNVVLSRLYAIIIHLVPDEHVHVHVDELAVEDEVVLRFVDFFVQ